jgi:acyl-CoA synthetase (AMP-forming)/AMP-acid ligase II
VGIPDERLGNEVCACIIPKAGVTLTKEDMLQAFDNVYITDEGLGMTPYYFLFLDALPTMGAKIDRKSARKMAMVKLGMQEA